ncbi:hypothetical protein XENOCAPTIV_008017 [Xenoophorus captivus]|uniref:Uncharacterized protein n=1 Tax=Xenoophorus captivus TaxID=1517983 RepID=A0ABV0RKC2_9TELE
MFLSIFNRQEAFRVSLWGHFSDFKTRMKIAKRHSENKSCLAVWVIYYISELFKIQIDVTAQTLSGGPTYKDRKDLKHKEREMLYKYRSLCCGLKQMFDIDGESVASGRAGQWQASF